MLKRLITPAILAGALLLSAVQLEAAPTTTENRLTVYLLRGTMYSGLYTHWGAAACSWNYPIGTQLQLPDGWIVTCLDRGHLGASGWLDLWMPDWETARWYQQHYGEWTTATVVRWGW